MAAEPGRGPGLMATARDSRVSSSAWPIRWMRVGTLPPPRRSRHAAEIVRLTGHATPVDVTIDGAARSFLAVAEQIDYPNLVCSWPSDSGWAEPGDPGEWPPVDSTGVVPPDGGGGITPDTVVAPPIPQRASRMHGREYLLHAYVDRVGAGAHGRGGAYRGGRGQATQWRHGARCHDRSCRRPARPIRVAYSPPDTTPGGGGGGSPAGYAGFMGEYLVRDVGSWLAVEGSQANALEEMTGACTDGRATFDWAEFECEAARLGFEFSMRVEPVHWERLTGVPDPPGGPEGSHTLGDGIEQRGRGAAHVGGLGAAAGAGRYGGRYCGGRAVGR